MQMASTEMRENERKGEEKTTEKPPKQKCTRAYKYIVYALCIVCSQYGMLSVCYMYIYTRVGVSAYMCVACARQFDITDDPVYSSTHFIPNSEYTESRIAKHIGMFSQLTAKINASL